MRLAVLLRVGLIAAIALAARASATQAAPKIEFISNTTRDFKTVYQGTPAAYGFFFRNAGDQTLVIERVEADCACTTAKAVPDRIAPGKQGKISVIFDTFNYKGQQSQTVSVTTNDPASETVVLIMIGHVKVAVDILPSAVIMLGDFTSADKRTKTITVVPVEAEKDFRITRVDTGATYIHASDPRRSSRDKRGFDIDITVGPNAPVGRVGHRIKIHTTSKKQPIAAARIYANVTARPR